MHKEHTRMTHNPSFHQFLFLAAHPSLFCVSEQKGGMAVCSAPGAPTTILFRSEKRRKKSIKDRKQRRMKMHNQEGRIREGLL